MHGCGGAFDLALNGCIQGLGLNIRAAKRQNIPNSSFHKSADPEEEEELVFFLDFN